ncbi:TetR/AcrR family transcriptional regulator [Micromonospora chaiyaphumensis]|uniref:Transcriptional regulator, TetR family n=1 Tax=Micromonospora chaiyaphumensis TaxID=307119 RepID=A0A1C4YCQ5_9ACTN|nr:TetR/AcrR family transcriptional regulator [Micromonospora chaiyaphumensis]SCF18416.1 transcriptional regulator, TetR family [Micromonospora chaiyaphumensis]
MSERRLPPVVARMWGRETSPRHGPRPSLDLARIVDAAIRIADRDGLDGVRMSSVAREVGMATMSLYRYVGSKDELLIAMADAAAPEPPALDGRAWRDYLTDWTRANRDFLLGRPWLLALGQHTPPAGPRALRWLDRALAALAGTGLGHGERINIATTLTGYATRQASLAHALNVAAAGEPIAGLTEYADILGEVLDPDGYPALTEAVHANAFGVAEEWIDDADFTFGLDLLLDGIQALIDRRREH